MRIDRLVHSVPSTKALCRLLPLILLLAGVCFFAAFRLNCGEELLSVSDAWAGKPVIREELPSVSDAWAGKPVMSEEHVGGMVNARLYNAPKLGELAPNFTLVNAFTGDLLSLRQLHHEKPVVLYFASYSCHISHDCAAVLKELSARFQDSVRFVVIYIREAHPQGGFEPLPKGRQYVLPARLDFADRVSAAQHFSADEKLDFPILVDTIDDSVNARWGAWPVRLFVVDKDGTIVFAGQQGPWFFKPTRLYDPKLPGVPEALRNIPGYSRESLEEFLLEFTSKSYSNSGTPSILGRSAAVAANRQFARRDALFYS